MIDPIARDTSNLQQEKVDPNELDGDELSERIGLDFHPSFTSVVPGPSIKITEFAEWQPTISFPRDFGRLAED